MNTIINDEDTARKLRARKRAEYCESEEYKQIKEKEYDDTLWLLKMASKKYANTMYDALAKNICQNDCMTDVERLTF